MSDNQKKRTLLVGWEEYSVIPKNKTTPWQDACKPIPPDDFQDYLMRKKRKKESKKKPLGLKAFYPTVKNSQGFDLHLCRYEPSIQDHVYVPKNYGKISQNTRWRNLNFCPSCKLKPCITVEHWDEIHAKAMEEHWANKKAEEEGKKTRSEVMVMKRIENFTMKKMTKYFGKEYTKQEGTPCCIIYDTQEYNNKFFNS